jgi:hypothetical protein
VRRYPVSRTKLHRRPCTVKTPWGRCRASSAGATAGRRRSHRSTTTASRARQHGVACVRCTRRSEGVRPEPEPGGGTLAGARRASGGGVMSAELPEAILIDEATRLASKRRRSCWNRPRSRPTTAASITSWRWRTSGSTSSRGRAALRRSRRRTPTSGCRWSAVAARRPAGTGRGGVRARWEMDPSGYEAGFNTADAADARQYPACAP